ncbi:MAG: ABC transporter permease [Chloroflexi bacterium OLB15]|nr:MAG: ABC transporter permease [Chloroflexi bacterium OLB15]
MGDLFATTATPTGFIIGCLCGLIPLIVGIHYRKFRAGIIGFIACVLSGFACGLFGGVPMIIISSSVVVSYAYVNRQDPFAMYDLAQTDDGQTALLQENSREAFLRGLAQFGDRVRSSLKALTRNKTGFIGFLGIMFFVLMTVFGPLFIEYDGQIHMDRRLPGATSLFQGPSEEFPLGLDWQGRDVLSHVIYGGQSLIMIALQAGLMATIIGFVFGAAAGLLGGAVDQFLIALSNFILTIPQFPLLLVLASLVSFDNPFYLALLFALLNWPSLMRAVRAQVLSLRERDYVQAAVALDLGLRHIILNEVFPNMVSYVAVNAIFSLRSAMYAVVGLVVLGLVPLREPDWGVMIFMGRQQGALFNPNASAMLLAPIIAISLFQLSLVLFTRSMEEIFNPRLRSGV